jgi:plastocyanin
MSLVSVVVATLALGACGSGGNKAKTSTTVSSTTPTSGRSPGTSSGSGTSAAAGEQVIAIQNFKFNPTPLTTKPGKVTVVIMDDGVPHSLTADDKSFDTGVFKKENGPKTITLSKTGTFNYHCEVHTFMKGAFEVS